MLTELAVGLGPSSAPGAASAVRPRAARQVFHARRSLDPPLPRPLDRGIKLAKN